jgi:tRNA threonylcarbamoyl adenosine modification protein (Sua5/YciO/YrdC/YwlC family)
MISISDAAETIRAGGLVAFPTETVYGLGANALDPAAVQKIFAMKRRPETSPLIVHVASVEMAREIVAEWPPLAEELARQWWPGPLTLVLPKKSLVPDNVTAGLPTVGVRMPNHPIALALIEQAGVPIAAPSANRFTELSPTTPDHVRAAFGDAVPVLEGGPCTVGIESTVVAIENGKLKLLRPGMISLGEIERTAALQPDDAVDFGARRIRTSGSHRRLRLAGRSRPNSARRAHASGCRTLRGRALPGAAPTRRGELAVDRGGDAAGCARLVGDPRPAATCRGTVE